jgi:gluconate 2-dehydrogenase gamma chain
VTDRRPKVHPRDGVVLYTLTGAHRRAMGKAQMSRRKFLAKTGALGSIAAVGAATTVAQDATPVATPGATPIPNAGSEWEIFEGVPDTPHQPPGMNFQALSEQEAVAVEMLTARLLPGTPDDPGAREAGVVYYIDFLLSQNEGFVEPTYRSGPWARAYEGDTEPDPEPDVIWVPADELDRYGYQAPLSPLTIYQLGLESLEEYAEATFDRPIAELDDDELDEMIWAMMGNEIEEFTEFSPISFFHTLRLHTSEGFFSDPGYGGNRDLAGWRLIGFPGAQRAYSPQEMQTEGTSREPQPMHELPVFNPGHTEEGPVMPVRGSETGGPESDEDQDDGDSQD